jgi:ankyrin repeat protein
VRPIAAASLALLASFAVSPGAQAQIKKCVDAQGNVTFTDRPCAANSKQQEVQVETTARPAPAPAAPPGRQATSRPSHGDYRGPARRPSMEELEACDEMRGDPTEAQIRRCSQARGLESTSSWAQLSDSSDSKERRVGVMCLRARKQLDLRAILEADQAHTEDSVGRFFAEYGGPDFASWNEAADVLCGNYAAAMPLAASREERLQGAQLVDAICGGRAQEARELLARGASPRSRSYEHDLTALHCAALIGDVALIRDLVARGARVQDISAEYALQPIHLAAAAGQIEAVRVLTTLGSFIDAPSLAGPPVVIALASGWGDIVPSRARKQLPRTVLDEGRRPAPGDGIRRLRAFIALRARLDGVNASRKGLLHLAAERGEPDTLAELLKHKLDVDAVDRSGATPLMVVARNQGSRLQDSRVPMAEALLAAGANVNARDAQGWSAFCPALANPPLLEVLVKYKVDPNVAGDDRRTACWGILRRNMAPSEIIAMVDGVPGLRTPRRLDGTPGSGPLLAYAYSTDVELVEYFLKRGLKPVDRTSGGWGVMHAVMKSSGGVNDHEAARRRIAKLLIDAGADLDLVDDQGETPLMVGYQQTPELVRYMIERGADVNAKNPKTGQSVLDIFEFRQSRAIGVLKAAGARNAVGADPRRAR